jgi:hypothetical protein
VAHPVTAFVDDGTGIGMPGLRFAVVRIGRARIEAAQLVARTDDVLDAFENSRHRDEPGEEPAVEHRYSLAHLTVLSLTPPEVVDVAARTGYGYASLRITRVTSEEPLYDPARNPALMRATKARLRDTEIAVHDVELLRLDASLEPEQFLPELDATAELGAHHIIAQLPDPDRSRATDRFARLCELSQPRGIYVSLELPCEATPGMRARFRTRRRLSPFRARPDARALNECGKARSALWATS